METQKLQSDYFSHSEESNSSFSTSNWIYFNAVDSSPCQLRFHIMKNRQLSSCGVPLKFDIDLVRFDRYLRINFTNIFLIIFERTFYSEYVNCCSMRTEKDETSEKISRVSARRLHGRSIEQLTRQCFFMDWLSLNTQLPFKDTFVSRRVL